MATPRKLNTADTANVLDKENTYKHLMQSLLPGIVDDQNYEVTGAQLAQLIYEATYFAHGNGRTRERQVSNSVLRFSK